MSGLELVLRIGRAKDAMMTRLVLVEGDLETVPLLFVPPQGGNGRELWEATRGSGQAREVWRRFLDARGRPRLLVVESGERAVLDLPWEGLADESGPLVERGIVLRRREPGEPSALPLGELPTPAYPFVGRAQEMGELERALGQGSVVLWGAEGQGKTALAAEAAWWLLRTGQFRRALYLSFEAGGDAGWAMGQMGRLLGGQELEASTLVVWDSLDSLFPGGPAELPDEGLRELLALGDDLGRRGHARLLMVSSSPLEGWANLELGGLGREEALELAGEVLGGEPPPGLDDLLGHLGYQPFSMLLVLPGLAGLSLGEARDLMMGEGPLAFFLARQSQDVREALPALGVFAGGAKEIRILEVTGWSLPLWRGVRRALEATGLARMEEGVWHVHPALLDRLGRLLAPKDLLKRQGRFRQVYYDFSHRLYLIDSRSSRQVRNLALREMANLRRALGLTLASGEGEMAVQFVINLGHFLSLLGRCRERENLVGRVEDVIRRVTGTTEGINKMEFLLASHEGEVSLEQGRHQEAEGIFRHLLEGRDRAQMGPYDLALTHRRLGLSLREQGRLEEAERAFRRALASMADLDLESKSVRHLGSALTTDLAGVLSRRNKAGEAKELWETALEIDRGLRDSQGVAVILSELGYLALEQGDRGEARERYWEALGLFRALGEKEREAVVLHQLGKIAFEEAQGEAQLLEEAEEAFLGSLSLKEGAGDREGAARVAGALALVSKAAGRLAQGEQWHLYAREIFRALGMNIELAMNAIGLARLLVEAHLRSPSELSGRDLLAEARREAAGAVEILEGPGRRADWLWEPYSLLAQIAEAQGDEEGVRRWRRREREAFASVPDSWRRYEPQWAPRIGAIRRALGGEGEAMEEVARLLRGLACKEDWRRLARALQRVMGGEEDAEALAEEYGLDRVDYLIVLHALGQDPGVVKGELALDDPEVRRFAPLVLDLVAICHGQGDLRPVVDVALEDLRERGGWDDLVGALERVLEGERGREALLEGLEETARAVVAVALEALEGNPQALGRLECMAGEAEESPEAQLGRIQEAFLPWLASLDGQAALGELMAQGLTREGALLQLLRGFVSGEVG